MAEYVDGDGFYEDEDFYDEPDYYNDDLFEDPRVNPCPDCDYGEVVQDIPTYLEPWPAVVCSAGCGWSA